MDHDGVQAPIFGDFQALPQISEPGGAVRMPFCLNQMSLDTVACKSSASDSPSTIGAPSARHGHTAVWAGSEMIVWGGQSDQLNNSTLFSDGARYNPVTDGWLPLPNRDSPSGRAGQTAVWTGSEMVVWGGNSGASWLNTGGRYNPANNNWSLVTTSGAPAPRQGHTAVWTGSEMILFGGYNNDATFGDTYAYSPSRLLYLYVRQ